MRALVFVMAVTGCATEQPASGVDQQATRCEDLFDVPPAQRAQLELFDVGPAGRPPLAIRIDDCDVFHAPFEPPGGFVAGYAAGNHTLQLIDNDVALPPIELATVPGDVHWIGLVPDGSPVVARGTTAGAASSVWRLDLMNVSGETLSLARATDPDAAELAYQPLAELPPGETFHGELVVSAQRGVPLRIAVGGHVTFEDNIGFNLACAAGSWSGGLGLFVGVAAGFPAFVSVYPASSCEVAP